MKMQFALKSLKLKLCSKESFRGCKWTMASPWTNFFYSGFKFEESRAMYVQRHLWKKISKSPPFGCHTLFPRSDFHPVLYLPKPSSLQIIPLSSYRPKLYFTKDFLPLNFFLILPLFNTPGILYSGYINFHWFNYPWQVSSFDLKFPVGYLAKI